MSENIFRVEQLHEVEITSLSSHGDGVGNINGVVIFVEGALPGEKVLARIVKVKKRFLIATCSKVLAPSSYRVRPPCPIFHRCGGCQVMNLDYEQQLHHKRSRVADALQRIGHIKGIEILPCLPSPEKLHYRNKIEVGVNKNNGSIGFHNKIGDKIIDVESCYIFDRQGDDVFQTLRSLLKQAFSGPAQE